MTPQSRFADLGFWQIPVIAGLIIVSFYPIEPVETKMQIIGMMVVAVVLLFLRHIADALNYQRFLILAGFVLAVVSYIGLEAFLRGSVNEYAANKLLYTIYILGLFGAIVPWIVYRAGGAKDIVPILLIVSIFFGTVSFFPTVESSNLRYSVIGLSPTMMSKLTLISSLLLAVYRSPNRWSTLFPVILFIFGVLATLNTGSRGSLIALALAYGAYSVLRGRGRDLVKYVAVLVVFAGLVYTALQFAPRDIRDRFTLEAVSLEENSDEGDRIELWQTAADGISDSFLGRGLGSFSLASPVAAPHNVVLEALYEIGYPAGAVFLFFLFFPLTKLRGLIRRDDWRVDFLVMAYLYNLVQTLYGGEMSLSNLLLYLTTGMVWLTKTQTALTANSGAAIFRNTAPPAMIPATSNGGGRFPPLASK